ncbi:MAG TPA: type IIL restriction-modification enzyme MmeI [Ignavibacteria bacterium]
MRQEVLNLRKEYPDSSLADLYDPISMWKELVDAYKHLDKEVDLFYRPQPFPTELSRLEFLFDFYKKYTTPMFAEEKKKKR